MNRVVSFTLSFFILIILLLTSLEINSYDLNFYNNFQEKNNISEDSGLSKEKLKEINNDFILFLKKGDTSLLDKHFNENEVKHMEDVYKLYSGGKALRLILIIFVIIILLYYLKKLILIYYSINLAKIFFFGSFIFLALIGLLFLNFENSFIIFHKIFFNNDLWLMNPNTDIMIRILTGDFFYQICIRIIIYFLIFFFYIIFIFKDNFIKF